MTHLIKLGSLVKAFWEYPTVGIYCQGFIAFLLYSQIYIVGESEDVFSTDN